MLTSPMVRNAESLCADICNINRRHIIGERNGKIPSKTNNKPIEENKIDQTMRLAPSIGLLTAAKFYRIIASIVSEITCHREL